jgi:hypothetical protein
MDAVAPNHPKTESGHPTSTTVLIPKYVRRSPTSWKKKLRQAIEVAMDARDPDHPRHQLAFCVAQDVDFDTGDAMLRSDGGFTFHRTGNRIEFNGTVEHNFDERFEFELDGRLPFYEMKPDMGIS